MSSDVRNGRFWPPFLAIFTFFEPTSLSPPSIFLLLPFSRPHRSVSSVFYTAETIRFAHVLLFRRIFFILHFTSFFHPLSRPHKPQRLEGSPRAGRRGQSKRSLNSLERGKIPSVADPLYVRLLVTLPEPSPSRPRRNSTPHRQEPGGTRSQPQKTSHVSLFCWLSSRTTVAAYLRLPTSSFPPQL